MSLSSTETFTALVSAGTSKDDSSLQSLAHDVTDDDSDLAEFDLEDPAIPDVNDFQDMIDDAVVLDHHLAG
ncbi:hypothetical protein ABBQ32_008774 [Trebouxia sp. C0010 RCD-2024]